MEKRTNFSYLDIYLYGMTVLSTIHLLEGKYPVADTYQEIKESYLLPGGEAGNAAIILNNLGCKVKLDGPHLGSVTKAVIEKFFDECGIDCSAMKYDENFEGVQDLVLIDEASRTVFGRFKKYLAGEKRWSVPDYAAIRAAKIAAVDPFFGEESRLVAEYCAALQLPYVTIDTLPESELHRDATATVISQEFIKNNFPELKPKELIQRYLSNSEGLVIMTFGAKEILYARQGGKINKFTPFKVPVKSTLGAGDSFRAGVVYGILNKFSDDEIVSFAAATAAAVCMRFPMALNPPTLAEIQAIQGK